MKAKLYKWDLPMTTTIRMPILVGDDDSRVSGFVARLNDAFREANQAHRKVMDEFHEREMRDFVQSVMDEAGIRVDELDGMRDIVEAVCDADIAALPPEVRDARLRLQFPEGGGSPWNDLGASFVYQGPDASGE